MQLATFRPGVGEAARPGAVAGNEIVDLSAIAPTMIELLEGGAASIALAGEHLGSSSARSPVGEIELLAPVRPRKFLAIGLNYADHVAESGQETPTNLTVFFKAATCVTGPFAQIERPAVSSALDYEGELGLVIGTRCRHVRAEEAVDVIAGYTIVNDVSVRDWQIMTPQWSLGKSFDTHGPIGPYIVTPDQVGDPHALGLRTYVNGDIRQRSNTENLIFSCFTIVEILSQACTLEPGDVIATGTPAGVAAGMEASPWLVPGDRVRIEIDGLDAIENEVVDEEVPTDFVLEPGWTAGSPLASREQRASR